MNAYRKKKVKDYLQKALARLSNNRGRINAANSSSATNIQILSNFIKTVQGLTSFNIV